MAQDTIVVQLPPAAQERLEERLRAGDFSYRGLDHARFSARGEGVVATLYRSGKLVVQGASAETFVARYLDGTERVAGKAKRTPTTTAATTAAATTAGKADAELDDAVVVRVGSDEAGKGDYFGPLVVAAIRLDPKERAELSKSRVTDSKKMTDEAILKIAPALEDRYDCAVAKLAPPDYNATHARVKNLNPMLADLHAEALKRVIRPGCDVLIDRFAREAYMQERLTGLDITLRQKPRAEAELAVAAASVVARAHFLDDIRELSERWAIDLRKGAGTPTDQAARAFVRLHGREKLGDVAKLHFKNTGKLPR